MFAVIPIIVIAIAIVTMNKSVEKLDYSAKSKIHTPDTFKNKVSTQKIRLIREEVTRAATQMQDNRNGILFTELEKALGYSAFINWLGANEIRKRSDGTRVL